MGVFASERSPAMSSQDGRTNVEALTEAAIGWLLRIESDQATGDDWAALAEWLEISEDHQAAFDLVERRAAEIHTAAPDILSALNKPSAAIIQLRPRPRRRGRWLVPATLAAACAGAVAAFGPAIVEQYRGPLQNYQTARGELRGIRLADGTRIQLDAATKISVRLGWRTRQVQLGDGEAVFAVARDVNRPFIVAVGDQKVRVLGTEFNIRHYDGKVVVTVGRGTVDIYQPALSLQPIARLTKGWELRHVEGSRQSDAATVNPQIAFAWTDGRLICNDQPLSEIAAYLNRRYRLPLRLSARAAKRRFSGVLELGQQTEVVRNLADYLSLSVNRSDQEITLR